MPRFFLPPEAFEGTRICIDGADARHISRSLRMRVGDELVLCDMSSSEYLCVISSITNESVYADIKEKSISKSEMPCRTVLYQGIAKGDKMDTVIQKAGEDIVGALAMGGLVNDGGNQSIVREIVHEHGAYLAFFKYCMCRSTLLCTAILKQIAAVGVGLTAATWFCGILRDIGWNYSACAGATALALTSSIAAFTRRSSATDSAGIISLTLSASIW